MWRIMGRDQTTKAATTGHHLPATKQPHIVHYWHILYITELPEWSTKSSESTKGYTAPRGAGHTSHILETPHGWPPLCGDCLALPLDWRSRRSGDCCGGLQSRRSACWRQGNTAQIYWHWGSWSTKDIYQIKTKTFTSIQTVGEQIQKGYCSPIIINSILSLLQKHSITSNKWSQILWLAFYCYCISTEGTYQCQFWQCALCSKFRSWAKILLFLSNKTFQMLIF